MVDETHKVIIIVDDTTNEVVFSEVLAFSSLTTARIMDFENNYRKAQLELTVRLISHTVIVKYFSFRPNLNVIINEVLGERKSL